LDGREYGHETDDGLDKQLAGEGIVMVFGYSDDNMEFRGAIKDEIGCCDGWTVRLTSKGILDNKCDNGRCPYFKEMERNVKSRIEAIWGKDGYSWIYRTDIPHVSFDITEDGEKYCRGIVFYLSDVDME
jgi:hypothetical protein